MNIYKMFSLNKTDNIPDTVTSNNASSFSSPYKTGRLTGRITLFFKAIRGMNTPKLYNNLSLSYNENMIDTFLLSFNIRDCRGGKGERELGVKCFIWLFINDPDTFMKIVHLIPEYGRWDDLLHFFPEVLNLTNIEFVKDNYCSIVNNERICVLKKLQKDIVHIFGDKLREDKIKMNNGEICSLAAKWAPTENDSFDKKYNVFGMLSKIMDISPRSLRKNYISPLRSYIKIVECFMCKKEWENIDYNKVPSCAMKKLKKTFEEHDQIRFTNWRESLKQNDPKISKVCTKQLFPYELVREMRTKGMADDICKAQWKVIEDECISNNFLDKDMVVVDTSCSMHSNDYLPYDVAVSIGLLISKCNTKFNGVITFSSNPEIVVIDEIDIYKRWRKISNINWGGSTNLQKTFKLILNTSKMFNVKPEDMPKRLWIISDMQFNMVEGYNETLTNFQAIDKMYKESGYIRPNIIFWNVNGSINDFPFTKDDNGTVMISGFSPSIMSSVLKGETISPFNILRNTLDSDRLADIKKLL